MAPCGFALLCKLAGEAVEVAGVAAGTEGSVDVPGEAVVGDPVDPGVPGGPWDRNRNHRRKIHDSRFVARAATLQPA